VSQERSRNYLRQLKGSALFKIGAIGASFLMLPLMIHYLGQEKFGVWSTMLSIVSWVVFFDLGVGNGLRNKLSEVLAKGLITEAKQYVSSGYTLIGAVALLFFAVAGAGAMFVPWQMVFNIQTISEEMLRNAVLLMILVLAINFWLGLINQVLNAVQKSAVSGFGQLLSNLLALVGLYGLVAFSKEPSLMLMAIVYGSGLIVSNVSLSIWFYMQRRELLPSLSLDIDHVRPLLSLGLRFFVIQCAVLVIFTTDKILITQLLGPQYVSQYDVVFKLFGVMTMIYGIVSAPLWSAYTDAYHRGDMVWIRNVLRQQVKIFMAICLATVGLILIAKPVIALWVGKGINAPFVLVISMAAFTIVSVWNNVFAFIVNGIGAIELQLKTAVVGMLVNIPLSIVLVKFWGMGVDGVVWATVISLLPFSLLAPFQVRSLLRRNGYETA